MDAWIFLAVVGMAGFGTARLLSLLAGTKP